MVEIPDYPDWIISIVAPTPPSVGSITILLDDKGMTRELTLYIRRDSSSPDLLIAGRYEYMKPREVGVFTQFGKTIDKVFDFINLFDHEVIQMSGEQYISTISSSHDNLWYILNGLIAKPYTRGQAFGRLEHYNISGPINIGPFTFYNMHNVAYQTDWLKTMNDYGLIEKNEDHPLYFIQFLVPDGKENEWQAEFETYYEFVLSTQLNNVSRSMLIQ